MKTQILFSRAIIKSTAVTKAVSTAVLTKVVLRIESVKRTRKCLLALWVVRVWFCLIKCKCKCIRNWPLPIGAFQDQCKQIVIKNPNWREADQLAIYKRRREVELGATENNIS